MLQMYLDENGPVCKTVGEKFVNDRLIRLLEDVMADYIQRDDMSYMENITCSEDWEKPLDTIIDMNRLRSDVNFGKDLLVGYTPPRFSPEKALSTFFSLYDLLKADEAYKPSLAMEYVLYNVLKTRLDICEDMPEVYNQVERVPEPFRTQMLEELTDAAGDLADEEGETLDDKLEFLMSFYEDMGEYIETCFEDIDCLLLDYMDEDELDDSGMVDAMGINVEGDTKTMRIEQYGGIPLTIDLSPWIMDKDLNDLSDSDNSDLPF